MVLEPGLLKVQLVVSVTLKTVICRGVAWKIRERGSMAFYIRFEGQLQGVSIYLQWKVQISAVLQENKLWPHVSTVVTVPTSDPIALDLHEVKEARAQRIILDGVKDHLIPHLAEKTTAKEMWDTLKGLYEAKNENRIMALKDKLHATKMVKGEGMASYLTKVA